MNPLFLLNLIFDLLKSDKPTVEEIKCARTVVENLIKYYTKPEMSPDIMMEGSNLSPEAQEARRELQ